MLKLGDYVSRHIDSLGDKQWGRQRAHMLEVNLKAVLADSPDRPLLDLLTPEVHDRLATYVADVQQRDTTTLDKRNAALRTIARQAMREGLLPNIPVFESSDDRREIKQLPQQRAAADITRLLDLYFIKREAALRYADDAERAGRLSDDARNIGLALLRVLLGGVSLDTLAHLTRDDVDRMKLPLLVATILSQLSSRRKSLPLGIIAPGDSAARQQRLVAELAGRIAGTLAAEGFDSVLIDDPLLTLAILAAESGAEPCDVRALFSPGLRLTHGDPLPAVLAAIDRRYSRMNAAWYALTVVHGTRARVRRLILTDPQSPAGLTIDMPRDTIYTTDDNGRRLAVDNPFFASMLLMRCTLHESLSIAERYASFVRLYGYVDSEGHYHNRISDEEKQRLDRYTGIVSKMKRTLPDDLPVGTPLLITAGKFRGYTARLVGAADATHVDVVLILLGASAARLRLPAASLQPVASSMHDA